MRNSLVALALLLGINLAISQDLDLSYGIHGTFPISKSSKAHLVRTDNYAVGYANINLWSWIKDQRMELFIDFNSDIHTENGDTLNVPEGSMSLMEGLFDYMNYIGKNEDVSPKLYSLFVSNQKKQVLVSPTRLDSDKIKVEITPINNPYLVNKFRINTLYVTFENGIPVEAYTHSLGILGMNLGNAKANLKE